MSVIKKENKIKLPEKAQIRIDCKGYPEERTLESVNRVKTYFSEKYDIPKG